MPISQVISDRPVGVPGHILRAPEGPSTGGGDHSKSPTERGDVFDPACLDAVKTTLKSLETQEGHKHDRPSVSTIKLSTRLPYETAAELSRLNSVLAEARQNNGIMSLLKVYLVTGGTAVFLATSASILLKRDFSADPTSTFTLLIEAVIIAPFAWKCAQTITWLRGILARSKEASESFEKQTMDTLGEKLVRFLDKHDPESRSALQRRRWNLSLDNLDPSTGQAQVTLSIGAKRA